MESEIIDWLLQGDVSIQYQVHRDLLRDSRPDMQARITREGWGAKFIDSRHPDGHWGKGFYSPKWTSTHYTVLDLKILQAAPAHTAIGESIAQIARSHKADEGGINPGKTIKESDVCINGMFLSYACHFGIDETELISIVDFVLDQCMSDGGFNCRKNRSGAKHSSMHSTISVLEGIHEYIRNGYTYRIENLGSAAASGREFLLIHQLYKSDRTGEVIHKDFTRLSFPGRWKYDILRALDYYRDAGIPWDDRMKSARNVLLGKRRSDGRWPLQARIPGTIHFEMEKPGQPSRWNTLRALRVLQVYPQN